jgi:threonine dehydratase
MRPAYPLAELDAAAGRVHAVLPPTPQYAWPLLGRRLGAEVWVKHENHTPVGAFKVRGGLVLTGGNIDRGLFADVLAGSHRD